jgi:hypothetical protein
MTETELLTEILSQLEMISWRLLVIAAIAGGIFGLLFARRRT